MLYLKSSSKVASLGKNKTMQLYRSMCPFHLYIAARTLWGKKLGMTVEWHPSWSSERGQQWFLVHAMEPHLHPTHDPLKHRLP